MGLKIMVSFIFSLNLSCGMIDNNKWGFIVKSFWIRLNICFDKLFIDDFFSIRIWLKNYRRY